MNLEEQFKKQTLELKKEFLTWLRKDGIKFFSDIKNKNGTYNVDLSKKGDLIPHPIHFREGMQIRNWMRTNGILDDVYGNLDNWYCKFLDICLEEYLK